MTTFIFLDQSLGLSSVAVPLAKAAKEISRLPNLFAGSGRVAVMAVGAADISFGSFGDGAALRAANTSSGTYDRLARRAGTPAYILLKETRTANTWIGYVIAGQSSGTVNYLSTLGIFKPMKTAGLEIATDGNGSLPDYPQTASTGATTWNIGALSAVATRLGIILGYGQDNCGVAKVTITNTATSGSVTPNLLPTAAQAVARGQIPSSQLIANGGVLDPADRVIGTSDTDAKWASTRWNHVPIADGLTPGAYSVEVTFTGAKGGQLNTATAVDRMYVAAATYGSDDMTERTTGAELMRCGYLTARNDASANETFTLGGYPTGLSTTDRLRGGGHGYETQSTPSAVYVDGVATTLRCRSVSRSRSAGGVATIVTDVPHGLEVGDAVTAYGFGVNGYASAGAIVTAIPSTTSFSYQVIGWATSVSNSAESTTADTGGYIIRHRPAVGYQSVEVRKSSILTDPAYGGGTGSAADMSTIYKLTPFRLEVTYDLLLNVDWTHTGNTFLGLTTTWGGSETTYGPEFAGSQKARVLGGIASAALTADNDAKTNQGEFIGASFIHAASGFASAVVMAASSYWPGWNSAKMKSHIQDRTGGLLEKWYMQAVSSGTYTTTAGHRITGSVHRYDAVDTNLVTDPIFA